MPQQDTLEVRVSVSRKLAQDASAATLAALLGPDVAKSVKEAVDA